MSQLLVKRLVPIEEARVNYLGGVGRTTVYELFKSGDLVKANIGRRAFVTAESLVAYLDRVSSGVA
jgi:hypothetical protein